MAYYWVTQAQRYIQSLGFGSTLPAVNKRQQLLRIDQFGGDNSFYREGTGKLTITLGKGGVDDAEDAEVIVHEYGHSVQDDQVPGFGSTPEAGAIGEALRRLPGRDGLATHFAPTRRRAVRRRLGLDVLHLDDAALPAPRRRRQALPRGPRAARSTPTARSGRARCGTSAARWAPSWPTRSSSARSSASRPTSRCRAAAQTTIAPRASTARARRRRCGRRSPRAGSRSARTRRCSGKDGRPRGRRPAGPWPSALQTCPRPDRAPPPPTAG